MNIIKINKEQYERLLLWEQKNKGLVTDNFCPYLLDGTMEIEVANNIYSNICFTIENPERNRFEICLKVFSKLLGKEDDLIDISFAFTNGSVDIGKVDVHIEENMLRVIGNDYIESTTASIIAMFLLVNAYFFHYKQDISELEVKTVRRKGAVVKGKYKYQNIKHLDKLYMLNNISIRKIAKKKQWHLDCWGVVGHIRHLRNGKQVYVRPYIKGKGRETNKTYTI